MNSLTLDLTDPDMAKALADCAVGETKTFSSLTGTLTAKDVKQASFDVTDVEYADEPAAAPEPPADDTMAPPAPATKKKRPTPPAVAAAAY